MRSRVSKLTRRHDDFPYPLDHTPQLGRVDLPGRRSGPSGWAKVVDESGLSEFARMLRDYHQAVAEWHPREEITWYDGSTGAGGEGEIVCHGDYGPWNGVIAAQRETHAKVEQLAARGHVRQRIALAEGAADRVAGEIAWAEQNRGLFSPG